MANKETSESTSSKAMARSVFGDPFGNLFEGFFRPMAPFGDGAIQTPAVDVRETEGAYIIEAELPGIKRDDIKVEVEEGVLTISGETKEESEEKSDGRVVRRERRYGSFRRDLRLGAGIKEADIQAKYENGVLVVTVPKSPDAPRRAVEVKVG